MSASIMWEPLNPNPKHFSVGAPSFFIESLKNADMELPRTFTEADVSVLKGMSAASGRDENNPYQQMINAIEKYGEITVWAQY